MRRILPIILLLLCGLASCALPRSECRLVPLTTMRLDMRQNLLFVTGGIGGHPVRLLVDTGAERTVLTQATVKRLALPHDPRHITRSFGIGGSSANWDAVVPGITLGETQFPVSHVAVGSFAIDQADGPPVDGLLGADILLAFDLDIDVPEHRLTLYRVRRCDYEAPPWHAPAARLEGIETQRDRLLVPIVLDGVKGMAILDTGAQATTIGVAMMHRMRLTDAELAKDRVLMAKGAAREGVPAHIHQFHELVIGGTARVTDPRLAVVPTSGAIGDALLGGDFLRGRRVWLSFVTRRLFIGSLQDQDIANR